HVNLAESYLVLIQQEWSPLRKIIAWLIDDQTVSHSFGSATATIRMITATRDHMPKTVSHLRSVDGRCVPRAEEGAPFQDWCYVRHIGFPAEQGRRSAAKLLARVGCQ